MSNANPPNCDYPRRHRRERRGAVTVEVAIVFPVLVFIVFGMVEYINAEFIRQGVAEATYEGCRNGIVRSATADEVAEVTANRMRMLGLTKATINVNLTDSDVTVVVSVPMAGNSFGVSNFIKIPEIIGSYQLAREKDCAGGTHVDDMDCEMTL